MSSIFFFQAEDGIRDYKVTGVQTCALPISRTPPRCAALGGGRLRRLRARRPRHRGGVRGPEREAAGAARGGSGGAGRRRVRVEHLEDRKSTRLNSSHLVISYAVFCLKKKKKTYSRVHKEL